MNAELVVIGSGPAGLSAAIEAAKYGVSVTVIDENATAGGQLFKQIHKFFGSDEHWAGIRGIEIGNILLNKTKELGVKILLNTVAWGIFKDHNIYISTVNKIQEKKSTDTYFITAKKIIIATGAHENIFAFPGWTQPGVIGAGAAQTIINVHRVRPGKRALIIGSGNVGLIVAYQMLLANIEVAGVIEFLPKISGYLVHAAKIIREGVPIYTSSTIVKAEGNEFVENAVIANVDKKGKPILETTQIFYVDTICMAVGLRPRIGLIEMIGCKLKYFPALGGFVPVHNDNMETTIKDFYIAGDLAGVGEASIAMEEGRLAGLSVAYSLGFIKEKFFKSEKINIYKRLNDLRISPFGQNKNNAKKELMSKTN